MTLAYDFDILDLAPVSGAFDPQLDGFLTEAGFKPKADKTQVALFRDPRTAEALRKAHPQLHDYFLASGFGLNTFSSGAPAGRYPARDEEARLSVIHRLTENAKTMPLPRPGETAEGGDRFRLGQFLADLSRAEPIQMTDAPSQDVTDDDGPASYGMPQIFETEPLRSEQVAPDPEPVRRKFWQSRFFKMAAAAGLVVGAIQIASGQSLLVLASL